MVERRPALVVPCRETRGRVAGLGHREIPEVEPGLGGEAGDPGGELEAARTDVPGVEQGEREEPRVRCGAPRRLRGPDGRHFVDQEGAPRRAEAELDHASEVAVARPERAQGEGWRRPDVAFHAGIFRPRWATSGATYSSSH